MPRNASQYGINLPNLYDQHLRRLFSDAPEHAASRRPPPFCDAIGPSLRKTVAHWTGEYQYIINQVLRGNDRSLRELELRLEPPVEQVQRDALVLVTVQTMNYLHGGHHRVAL